MKSTVVYGLIAMVMWQGVEATQRNGEVMPVIRKRGDGKQISRIKESVLPGSIQNKQQLPLVRKVVKQDVLFRGEISLVNVIASGTFLWNLSNQALTDLDGFSQKLREAMSLSQEYVPGMPLIINFSGNKLTVLFENGSLANLGANIIGLDFSYNNIGVLDMNTFKNKGLDTIFYLNMVGNPIERLSMDIFEAVPYLELLLLDEQVQCDYDENKFTEEISGGVRMIRRNGHVTASSDKKDLKKATKRRWWSRSNGK